MTLCGTVSHVCLAVVFGGEQGKSVSQLGGGGGGSEKLIR